MGESGAALRCALIHRTDQAVFHLRDEEDRGAREILRPDRVRLENGGANRRGEEYEGRCRALS
jgi:hypothetical protein